MIYENCGFYKFNDFNDFCALRILQFFRKFADFSNLSIFSPLRFVNLTIFSLLCYVKHNTSAKRHCGFYKICENCGFYKFNDFNDFSVPCSCDMNIPRS